MGREMLTTAGIQEKSGENRLEPCSSGLSHCSSFPQPDGNSGQRAPAVAALGTGLQDTSPEATKRGAFLPAQAPGAGFPLALTPVVLCLFAAAVSMPAELFRPRPL